MKNHGKKAAAAAAALILAAALLASCGSPAAQTPSAPEGTPSENAAAVHTLKLLGKVPEKDYVDPDKRNEFPAWQEIEKGLAERGIKLEYERVSREQYPTVIQTRMASGVDLPDIVNHSPLDDTTALSLGQSGTIIDIGAAIDQYSDGTAAALFDNELAYAKQLTTAPDGKRYWIPTCYAGQDILQADGSTTLAIDLIGSSIRKDWLDKVGLPVPTTVDEWLTALRTFREKDVNGSGEADEILLFDVYSYSFFTGIAQWYGLVPDVAAYDPVADRVVSPWYQEGVKDYFRLMNTLANEGIFDVGMVGATDEVCNARIAEDKVASMRSYAVASWFEDLIKTNPDAEYQMIPTLKAKDGITPYTLSDNVNMAFDKYAVTKSCTDVEGAVKLFDYLCTEEYYRLTEYGMPEDYTLTPEGTFLPAEAVRQLTPEDAYSQRVGRVSYFVADMLPRIAWPHGTLTAQHYLDRQRDEKALREAQVQLDHQAYRPTVTSPFSSKNYAIASSEEVEITNKYYTALKTYSEELAMNLILGNESLDDWDLHIAKLQELGSTK